MVFSGLDSLGEVSDLEVTTCGFRCSVILNSSLTRPSWPVIKLRNPGMRMQYDLAVVPESYRN